MFIFNNYISICVSTLVQPINAGIRYHELWGFIELMGRRTTLRLVWFRSLSGLQFVGNKEVIVCVCSRVWAYVRVYVSVRACVCTWCSCAFGARVRACMISCVRVDVCVCVVCVWMCVYVCILRTYEYLCIWIRVCLLCAHVCGLWKCTYVCISAWLSTYAHLCDLFVCVCVCMYTDLYI